MNFTDVDKLPSVAAYLHTLGQSLSRAQHHRSAALAYASASRASGTTRQHQAYALYKAAQQLYLSVQTTSDDDIHAEDRTRALGYLQKCSMLIRDLPSCFEISVQVFALIENISTFTEDSLSAAKTINVALNTIASGADDPSLQLRWWCYFRGRAIANALASGNSVRQAAVFAAESASMCERSGDSLSAAAFHLVESQVALGASVAGQPDLASDIPTAVQHLDNTSTIPLGREMDYLLCRFGVYMTQCLVCIRQGNLRVLKDELVNLSTAYNRLRHGRKERLEGQWHWWPHHYLSAITYYIMTAVSRSNCDLENALSHSMTALSRLGVTKEQMTTLTLNDIAAPSVPSKATLSFAVALLENAARIQLTRVRLEDAAGLIAAAVKLSFLDESARKLISAVEAEAMSSDVSLDTLLVPDSTTDSTIVPRCTTFLLIAEYHNLRGRVTTARVATAFLDAVRNIKTHHRRPFCVSDTWHMVISYLSLLTGDERCAIANVGNDLPPVTESEDPSFTPSFISKQVLALAWFTVGVFHTRKTDVLESRKAVTNCLDIVNESPFGNEQLIANASAVLSGLVMARDKGSDEGPKMAVTAVDLANQLADPVAIVRATRQRKKVLHRMSQSLQERQHVDAIATKAFSSYTQLTENIGPISTAKT